MDSAERLEEFKLLLKEHVTVEITESSEYEECSNYLTITVI